MMITSAHNPPQMRRAACPIRLLPAAIWAEPGITRVMPRKVSPRRSMTRSARRMAVPGRGGSDSLAIGTDETSSRTSSAVLFDT